jgi:hypothetical protein
MSEPLLSAVPDKQSEDGPGEPRFWQNILRSGKRLPPDFDIEAEAAYYAELLRGPLASFGSSIVFESLLGGVQSLPASKNRGNRPWFSVLAGPVRS